ncbi:MAG: flotillin-like FloA family protein, partial [Bacteroidales bacterium]
MILIYILISLFLILVILNYFPIGVYMSAKVSGLVISIWELVKYKHRNYPIHNLIYFNITLSNIGINLKFSKLAESYKANVDLENVVNGLIAAKQINLPLTFEQACSADKK